MADTLFDATLATARRLGIARDHYASTAGTTETLLDTVSRTEPNDYWNGGTIWITEDQAGAGAAPEGEYGVITGFANGTSTITFPALTAATAENDKYAVAAPIVPLQVLISQINLVLLSVYIPAWDTTTLDTVSGQTEYTLPATVTRGNLLEVRIQSQDDADDNRPVKANRWWVKEAATGSQDTLVLKQFTDGWDIWLKYKTRHPAVRDSDDKINEIIDLDGLAVASAVECLHELMATGSDSKFIEGRTNRLMGLQELIPVVKYPLQKASHFRTFSGARDSEYTGTVGKVRL